MKHEGQKMKLFALKEILEQETDTNHGIPMKRIIQLLEDRGIKAERKSIYDDLRAFRDSEILDVTEPQGQNREYSVVSRDFDPDEVKLLVDAVQASKFLSDAKTKTLVKKLKRLCSRHEAAALQRQVIVTNRVKSMNNKPNTTTGAITILDSAWDISMVFYPKYYPDQKDTEQVFWFDTLYGERTGDYIKKPSSECTGEEIMTEFLYHMGMLDMKDDILAHSYISTCMMPYITSQFMPRQRGDRPSVIPEGCTNLALIGQFVELPGDVVFTVETSVRTAMMAAYGLLKLDKPVVALYEGQWDIRLLVSCLKKLTDKKELDLEDLPPINPLKIKSELKKLLAVINSIPQLDHNKVNY